MNTLVGNLKEAHQNMAETEARVRQEGDARVRASVEVFEQQLHEAHERVHEAQSRALAAEKQLGEIAGEIEARTGEELREQVSRRKRASCK